MTSLEEIKRLLAAASPGPWRAEDGTGYDAGDAHYFPVWTDARRLIVAKVKLSHRDTDLPAEARRPSPSTGGNQMNHHNTSTSVKALDLSRVLQHALLAGQKGVDWVDYDPMSNPAYQRITECLETKASGWWDIESAPKDGTEVLLYFQEKSIAGRLPYIAQAYVDCDGEWWICGEKDHAEAVYGPASHWQPLPPPPGDEAIYQDAHRASVRSTIATSMKREEAIRAENAELKARYAKLEAAVRQMVDAISKGAVDSEEIVPVPGDGPPYRFHEEWAHYARSALATKGGEDD